MALGPQAHADDHGDDRASATAVALPSETAGEITWYDDDWFRFEVTASGGVAADIIGDVHSTVSLYDTDGNELARDFRGIHQTLDAGTYYVCVCFHSLPSSYVLRLQSYDPHGDIPGDVHGDDRASATRVELPSETAGEINAAWDADWFRFEVATGALATAESTGGMGGIVGRLYDADGSELAVNRHHPGRGRDFLIRGGLPAGAYYVEVKSEGNATGRYALRLSSGPPLRGSSVTSVPLPGDTDGEIETGHGLDWFRFEVGTRALVTAETAGGLDTLGRLYDADGNEIAFNDDAATGLNFYLRRVLATGAYYVRVSSFGFATGRYALRLGFAAGDDGTTATAPAEGHLRTLGDFDGDGRDDVLLRHADGRWHYYLMDGANVLDGGGAANLPQDLAWRLAGIGDFDGDGKDDMLLRKTDGRWHFYPMDGRNVLPGHGTVPLTRDLAWRVAGIGDFDGDGRDDVLLRKTDGRWYFYPMDGRNVPAGRGTVRMTRTLAWQMAGVGDFDGDGKDDVLLRRRDDGRWFFYPMNGRAPSPGRGTVPLTWDLAWGLAGVGDFDADGRHDVLLRHTDGRWRYYPMQGRRVLDGAGVVDLADDTSTTIAGIGDLNGDGRDDVLARLANGDWQYYALDGRRVLSASGSAVLSGDTFRDCAECPLMVRIPAGTFTMGAPESEPASHDDERPQRTVSIPAFAAGAHEVTFAQWDACLAAGGCGGHDPRGRGYWDCSYHPFTRGCHKEISDNRPIVDVSWDDAQRYVDWLSRRTGQRYRLLTESEWEYAARAGTTTPFHTGETITPKQANFYTRYDYPSGRELLNYVFYHETLPVGSFAPNGFGLYDVHGNVAEWVQDCIGDYAAAPDDGSAVEGDDCSRVFRGGAWGSRPSNLRAATRFRRTAGFRDTPARSHVAGYRVGFRVARTL